MTNYRVRPTDSIADDTIRSSILVAARSCIGDGVFPSHKALHRYGVRGSHERIGQVRDALIDEGLLAIPKGLQRQEGRRHLRPDHHPAARPPEGYGEARLIRRVLARRGGVA